MKKHLIYLLVIFIACMLLVAVQRTKAEAPEGKPLTIQEYAEMRVEQEFGEGQWESFNSIIIRESRWNHLAKNPSSSAFGLAQFLTSTYRAYGTEPTSDPYLQIELAIKYMDDRYDSPNGAWKFWQVNHWY